MIKKIFKTVLNAILILLVSIGVLVVFSFVPFPGNYKVMTVLSGSMSPAIHTGSLIFVKPLADYNVGDIITRRTNDQKVTITHRIASKEEIEGKIAFQTKGDANNAPDMEKFTAEGIVGKAFLAIPLLGYLVSYAKTTPGIILLIIIPAVIIVYDELQKIKEEIKNKIAYRKLVKIRQEKNEKAQV